MILIANFINQDTEEKAKVFIINVESYVVQFNNSAVNERTFYTLSGALHEGISILPERLRAKYGIHIILERL